MLVTSVLMISPGFAISIFMILSCQKYWNPYFSLFTSAYIGTGIMALTMMLRNGIHLEDYISFDLIEMLCILCIIESCTWLVMKLFYDRLHILLKIAIVIVGIIPPVSYTLAWIFWHSSLYTVYNLAYLFFFILLGIDCAIFGLNFRKIAQTVGRKFGVLFCILLLVFLTIFITQRILCYNFNPLFLFYFLWSVLLIWFSWKYILSDGLDKLFHVQESFAKRFNITKREEEIIELVIQGYKNSKIGEILFISEKTVTNHIYNIYKKLEISSRFELICLFKQ